MLVPSGNSAGLAGGGAGVGISSSGAAKVGHGVEVAVGEGLRVGLGLRLASPAFPIPGCPSEGLPVGKQLESSRLEAKTLKTKENTSLFNFGKVRLVSIAPFSCLWTVYQLIIIA